MAAVTNNLVLQLPSKLNLCVERWFGARGRDCCENGRYWSGTRDVSSYINERSTPPDRTRDRSSVSAAPKIEAGMRAAKLNINGRTTDALPGGGYIIIEV